MSDLAVGKNGIGPPQLAPARIFRPGDAGFPDSAGHYTETRDEPMSDKPCRFEGCGQPKAAGRGKAYCATHTDPKARLPSNQPAKAQKPSTVADAIGKLRAKAAPTGTGKGGDLHQQLSERRAQMLADIEAIDRVLAIV